MLLVNSDILMWYMKGNEKAYKLIKEIQINKFIP